MGVDLYSGSTYIRENAVSHRSSAKVVADLMWLWGHIESAEVCELVLVYGFSKLVQFHDKVNICLYRDDGLAVLMGFSGPQAERIRKRMTQEFKKLGLRITIEGNLKAVNYLDITLDLNSKNTPRIQEV